MGAWGEHNRLSVCDEGLALAVISSGQAQQRNDTGSVNGVHLHPKPRIQFNEPVRQHAKALGVKVHDLIIHSL